MRARAKSHAGLVAVDVQQAAGALVAGQGDFREVDRGEGGAVVEYLTSLLATSRPMFSWASWVEPPMWGVRMTLSRPRSGVRNSSSLDLGSLGKTSMAAPER
jgi:hypothetical protein